MVTEELLRYVEYQKNRGVDKNSIKMALIQSGWTGDDINEAFTVVDTISTDTSTPEQPEVGKVEVSNPASSQNQPTSQVQTQNAISGGAQVAAEPQAQSQVQLEIQAANSGTTQQSSPLTQVNAQPASQNTVVEQIANTNIPNQQTTQQSAIPVDNLGSPTVANPQTPESIKYRTAQDWQKQNPGIDPNKTVAEIAAAESVNTAATQTAAAIEKTNQVLRPSVNAGYQQTANPQPAQSIAELNQQPAVLSVNPKAELKSAQSKPKSNKLFYIIGSIILLVAIAAGAFFVLDPLDASPDYDAKAVINAFETVQYVEFDATGSIPLALENANGSLPLAFNQLGSVNQVPIVLEGLINTQSNKNGFGLSVSEVTFDYVYDGSNSYGKFRQLPDKEELSELEGDWFDFTDANQTRSVLKLISNEPASSLPDVAKDLGSAIGDLYESGLIDITYVNSIESASGEKLDVFNFSFDAASLASRINTNSVFLTELLDYSGINNISGIAQISRDTKLIQDIELTLSNSVESTVVSIDFSYDYAGVAISAPPNTVPADNIINVLDSLSGGEESALLDKMNLLATDASVHQDQNGNFTEFCSSDALAEFKEFTLAQNAGQVVCNNNETNFAVSVGLPNPKYYGCVDASYLVVTTETVLQGNTYSCGVPSRYQSVNGSTVEGTGGDSNANVAGPGGPDGSTSETEEDFFD